MQTLRVLIVDDEPLARLRLRSLVQGVDDPPSAVVGEAGDADEALRWLRGGHGADVMLLDIRMPGPDTAHAGLHLAARLKALPDAPAVVFVSAYAEHALRAFELQALDYLTKPVRRERLAAALHRVAQRRVAPAAPTTATAATNTLAATATVAADRTTAAEGPLLPAMPVLVLADRGRVLRLPLDEVLYFKAEQKYVTVRTVEHAHIVDDALSELEQRVGGGFLRVHRNALVARRAIRALQLRPGSDETGEGWAVRVAPLDEWLAVSRRQVAAVKAALESNL